MKSYLVIFKRQEGQEKWAYSFIDDLTVVHQMKMDKIIEAVIEAPKQKIYSKADVIQLVQNSPISKKVTIE